MSRDTALGAVTDELEQAGFDFTVSSEGKHHKVRFSVGAKPCLIVVAKSASDHRAIRNMRALTRRVILRAISEGST